MPELLLVRIAKLRSREARDSDSSRHDWKLRLSLFSRTVRSQIRRRVAEKKPATGMAGFEGTRSELERF